MISKFSSILCVLCASVVIVLSQAEAKKVPPVVKPSPPPFLILVDQQPAESFAGWKAIGVNGVLDVPQGHDPVAWRAEAERLELWQLRQVIGDAAEDAKRPYLFAWAHHDEPEADQISAAACQAEHDATQAVAPGVPWFSNFDGSRVLGIQGGLGQADYAPYLKSAEILSQDVYPVSGWNNEIPLASPFNAYARLTAWAPNKPQFVVIGCGRQGLEWLPGGGRAETKEEFLYFLRTTKAIGARGVILFPIQPRSGFKFDVMPAELKNALADFSSASAK